MEKLGLSAQKKVDLRKIDLKDPECCCEYDHQPMMVIPAENWYNSAAVFDRNKGLIP